MGERSCAPVQDDASHSRHFPPRGRQTHSPLFIEDPRLMHVTLTKFTSSTRSRVRAPVRLGSERREAANENSSSSSIAFIHRLIQRRRNRQESMEMDMNLDVGAAKGVKRPTAAVEDLEDDGGERRFEEKLRTKVHKGRCWVHPPEIRLLLQQMRIQRMRTADCIARGVII